MKRVASYKIESKITDEGCNEKLSNISGRKERIMSRNVYFFACKCSIKETSLKRFI